MTDFTYIFGLETPRQRVNNLSHGWGDEDSHDVAIEADDAAVALAWGDRIAQKYIALLHDEPELDWGTDGYASWVETKIAGPKGPRVRVGEFPDFTPWLGLDRPNPSACSGAGPAFFHRSMNILLMLRSETIFGRSNTRESLRSEASAGRRCHGVTV